MDLEEIRRLAAVASGLRAQADALQSSAPSVAQNLRAQATGIENSIPNTAPIQSMGLDQFMKGMLVGTLLGALGAQLFRK